MTGTSFTGTLPPFLHYTHANLFPRNQLALIPNFNKENDDSMRPTSSPYNPEQVIRDCEAHHPLPTLPSPSTPTSVSMTLVGNDPSIPIIVNMPSPQSPVVPVKEKD